MAELRRAGEWKFDDMDEPTAEEPDTQSLRDSEAPLIITAAPKRLSPWFLRCTICNICVTMALAAIMSTIAVVAFQTDWEGLIGLDGARAELAKANNNMGILQDQLKGLQANVTTLLLIAKQYTE
jgi:hypothetical protein